MSVNITKMILKKKILRLERRRILDIVDDLVVNKIKEVNNDKVITTSNLITPVLNELRQEIKSIQITGEPSEFEEDKK